MKAFVCAVLTWALLPDSAAAVAAFEPVRQVVTSGHGEHLWNAGTSSSDQIQAKLFVDNRRRHGDLQDLSLRLEFTGVPQQKEYQVFIQTMEMDTKGLPPAPVPDNSFRMSPDAGGSIEVTFVLGGYSRGEWADCILQSTDGTVRKAVRMIPFK